MSIISYYRPVAVANLAPIVVPHDDGTVIAYCHLALQFQPDAFVSVQGVAPTLLTEDNHSLHLRPLSPLPQLEEYEVVQSTVVNASS